MLKELFTYWFDQLGDGTSLAFYVNYLAAFAIGFCSCIVFSIIAIRVVYYCGKGIPWVVPSFLVKVDTILKGVVGLILSGYIIYLLIAWNSWNIITLEAFLVFCLNIPVVAVVGLTLIYCLICFLIYRPIKKMFLSFKKK